MIANMLVPSPSPNIAIVAYTSSIPLKMTFGTISEAFCVVSTASRTLLAVSGPELGVSEDPDHKLLSKGMSGDSIGSFLKGYQLSVRSVDHGSY